MDAQIDTEDPVGSMMERVEWRRRLALRLTRLMRIARLAPGGDPVVRTEINMIISALEKMRPDDVAWVLERLPQLRR